MAEAESDTGAELAEMFLDTIDEDDIPGPTSPTSESLEDADDLDSTEDSVLSPPQGQPFIPPCQRPNAPLSNILSAEHQLIDPREFYPDFKFDKPLRFSRIFGINPKTLSKNLIWWPVKTFKKTRIGTTFPQKILPPPKEEECVMDQTALLLDHDLEEKLSKLNQTIEEEEEVPSWRYGPAQMWFDRMGVPEKPKKFDYGFKMAKNGRKQQKLLNLPEENLLPVSFTRWEDDVIMDANAQSLSDLKVQKVPQSGWIATQTTRTLKAYRACWKDDSEPKSLEDLQQHLKNEVDDSYGPDQSHSIFPLPNEDVEYISWEKDIIFDADNMQHQLKPKTLTLSYEDDPLVLGMPEDIPLDGRDDSKHHDKKDHQFTKKSKMILGQVQRRQKQEEEEQLESTIAQIADKDPFNMSNDDYYFPKNTQRSVHGSLIQHSIPAQNIHRSFFPTTFNPFRLRHMHRLPLNKKLMRDVLNQTVPIHNLVRHMRKAEEQRRKQKTAEGGGDIFYMRALSDLSGRDGTLILVEYSEEHPPLLSQPGMASKIRNYYRRKAQKENEPSLKFGETAYTMNSPFLGNIMPGQCLQAIENNMYRAPIYEHQAPLYDFLLIRTKYGFFIRECPPLFVVGQECPLGEVPSPNSKRATVFVRDFLLAFIYRLFWASDQNPRRLRMDDIKNAFPHYAESSVRKRLKQCSDFKRMGAGTEQNYWVVRDDFRLPSKEEVLNMVTPEMCCAQYSMMAAEQRLKDAGYGEKYFFTPENEDDSDDQVTMEDEVKCAPWNTTRAYLSAMKGKCLLDQTGIADPSGCGQGFSYVKVSAKPQKDDSPQIPKRLVTGTNADLRKLPLKEAKEICRSYGVKEEEINALTRWEIIDVIRTLSTQAAKARSDFSGVGMARFARGNIRFNFADMQDKYKKYCQHVFDLQNQALSCNDVISTDEGSDNDDSDNDDMVNRLEKMLGGRGKNASGCVDDEERDRMDLQKMMKKDDSARGPKDLKTKHDLSFDPNAQQISGTGPRKLKIYRTVKSAEGVESTRVEVINNPHVIEAYVRIRSKQDNDFIKVYAQMDEQYKEERRKEKRRLQDQLRRIRRNELKQKIHTQVDRTVKKKPEKEKKPVPIKPSLLKMRCSACGEMGHMKTNKNCKLYGKELPKTEKTVGDILNSTTGSNNMDLDGLSLASGELVELEGTRMKVSTKFFKHAEQQDKGSLKLRIPKHLAPTKNRESSEELKPIDVSSEPDDELTPGPSNRTDLPSPASTVGSSKRGRRRLEDADYLLGPQKSVQRRRADPRVSMSSVLLEVFNEMKAVPGVEPLMQPVNAKAVKDYYDIIKDPIDLQAIRKKINENKYELRRQFLADLGLMHNNAKLYNGLSHPITLAANRVFELACRRLKDHELRLIELEKAINPLLDDNDMVGFSFVLQEVVQRCKNLPKSVAFHTKVDIKKFPKYLEKISRPMDLGTIEQQVKDRCYRNVESFLLDVKQIVDNSTIFNGENSVYTEKARDIYLCAKALVDEKAGQLRELENRIAQLEASQETHSVASLADDELTRDTFFQSGELTPYPDDEETMDWSSMDLAGSKMQQEGQLNADLELSDTDSDDEGGSSAKRMRVDDDLDTL